MMKPQENSSENSLIPTLDRNGDLLTLVYDSTPIEVEKERDALNKQITATTMRDRAVMDSEPTQLSF
jgi:hypothetical protein